MPKMNKLRVDTSYKEDVNETEDIPMNFCNIELNHSGEKSAFTPVKQKNVNGVILERQHMNETRNQRKSAFRTIKGLFNSSIKQVCPCVKEKESNEDDKEVHPKGVSKTM
jgi:hypothetical protein